MGDYNARGPYWATRIETTICVPYKVAWVKAHELKTILNVLDKKLLLK